MKRDSLKLQNDDWEALDFLAAKTGSTYSGKPSWRTLVKRIARGELVVASAAVGSLESSLGRKVAVPLVSRNAPCPCGSGQKFKRCCGKKL